MSRTAAWRRQELAQAGVDGLLRDKTRPARIPPLGPEVAERVVALTQADPLPLSIPPCFAWRGPWPAPPGETTQWTAAAMAKVASISVSSVRRIWRGHGLQPQRVRQVKLSTDSAFAAKLRDVVGHEKSQIQALARTQDRCR